MRPQHHLFPNPTVCAIPKAVHESGQPSRVGWDRVGSGRVGSRRVGSEGLQIPRVGLGHPYPIRPARRDATHEKPCSFPAWRVRINLRVSCLISQKSKLRKNQIVLYATIFCLYRVQPFLLPTNPHKLKTSYACTSASS